MRAYWGRAAIQGTVFRIFVLNRVSILSLCRKQGILFGKIFKQGLVLG